MTAIEEIVSSRARLTIASLLSSRPRTLGELAETTGMSVQGVLKHLKILSRLGILRTKNLSSGRYLRSRKLYYIDSRRVADYSEGDMTVAVLGREIATEPARVDDPSAELDRLAQDVILMRRRAEELAERMRRTTEEVTEDESRISRIIEGLDITTEEKQITYLSFGDDRPEKVRRILREHYGCRNPDEAINGVAMRLKEG